VAKATGKHSLKPVLYKSVFQVRYKPRIEFYNRMFTAAKSLEGFPDWETDGLSVTVFNFENRCSAGISFDSISYAQDSNNLRQERDNISQLLGVIPEVLGLNTFLRFGLRRWYLTPVDFDFDSLASIMTLKLFNQDESFQSYMLPATKDMSYINVCSDDKYAMKSTVGPMRKNEIPNYIKFQQQQHLPPDNRAQKYFEIVNNYPEVCAYFDVDYFQQSDKLNMEEAMTFIHRADDFISKAVDGINNYLFSEKVEG
jgi:hypothetical protein